MNIITISLLLKLFTGPILSIEYINVGSEILFDYNQITLNATFNVNNNYVGTTDTFYDTYDVNLTDYSIDLNNDVNQITQTITYGTFRLQSDNLTFNYQYELSFYDNTDVLIDTLSITRNLTFIMAEPFVGGFANTTSSITSTNIIYDYDSLYSTGYNEGVDVGFDNGYEEGYEEGKTEGYEEGKTEGQFLNNVISWFGSIWDALKNLFTLEIAPNVSIGLVFGIPIFIGLLWFLLRALIN